VLVLPGLRLNPLEAFDGLVNELGLARLGVDFEGGDLMASGSEFVLVLPLAPALAVVVVVVVVVLGDLGCCPIALA
jgi:hypothetical protein